ncbi:hypothetical protein PPYR_15120 [Photinus pyralis]|uniref:PHD-type domain-containing protein n=1 Tax=Photinus pyralis TaxID=7054 RepID=A0A5N3ZZJ1_PHOPY|nr:hypothetical protein PPYR_15120 [Photinus pyralis]
MPSISKCNVCANNVDADKELKCDACDKPVHTTCSGLSRAEIKCLNDKDRRIKFLCENCSSDRLQLGDLVKMMLEMRDEINALKKASSSTLSDAIYRENLISEMNERNLRSRNIIIHGLDECEGTIEDQKKEDLRQVVNVIDKVAPVSTDHIMIYRLGRAAMKDKVRPIKVVLNSRDDAVLLLKNKAKLPRNGKLYITADETLMQREFLKSVRLTLHNRIQNGESNLTIKYIRNVPTIVSSKNATPAQH